MSLVACEPSGSATARVGAPRSGSGSGSGGRHSAERHNGSAERWASGHGMHRRDDQGPLSSGPWAGPGRMGASLRHRAVHPSVQSLRCASHDHRPVRLRLAARTPRTRMLLRQHADTVLRRPRPEARRPAQRGAMSCCLCGSSSTAAEMCELCGREVCEPCRRAYERPDGHCSRACRYREHPMAQLIERLNRVSGFRPHGTISRSGRRL